MNRLQRWLLVIIVGGCAGCTAFTPPPVLPASHTLVLDPLVVYSDFALPPHHRLLE